MTAANTPDLRALAERLDCTEILNRLNAYVGSIDGSGDTDLKAGKFMCANAMADAAAALTTLQHQLAEMEAALEVSTFMLDATVVQLRTWGVEPTVNVEHALRKARSTLKDRGEGR